MHFPFKAPFLNEETNLSKSYTLEGEYIFIFWWTIPLRAPISVQFVENILTTTDNTHCVQESCFRQKNIHIYIS